MDKIFSGLDSETQLLVALGAAVACGCIPCLESIVKMARSSGIEEKKLKAAAIIGQYVKDQPAAAIKARADALLATHLDLQDKWPCPVAGDAAPARPSP